MVPTRATTIMLSLLATTVALGGCLSDGTALDRDGILPPASTDAPPATVPVEWQGHIEARSCYEGGLDTCQMLLKSEEHVRWFEVELPGIPLAGHLQADWDAHRTPETGFHLRLVCWDRSVDRCAGDGPDLARDEGTEAPLTISVSELAFLEPGTGLYVAFGVPARETPAGEAHPAADVEFALEGAFLVPAGGT